MNVTITAMTYELIRISVDAHGFDIQALNYSSDIDAMANEARILTKYELEPDRVSYALRLAI